MFYRISKDQPKKNSESVVEYYFNKPALMTLDIDVYKTNTPNSKFT